MDVCSLMLSCRDRKNVFKDYCCFGKWTTDLSKSWPRLADVVQLLDPRQKLIQPCSISRVIQVGSGDL